MSVACAMPISNRAPDVLVDTSVAVALSVADHEDHEDHEATFQKARRQATWPVRTRRLRNVPVLTRLPPPERRSPATVTKLMSKNFPANRFLSARAAAALTGRLAEPGVAGGAAY